MKNSLLDTEKKDVTLSRDGNQWCALMGDNLQVGVAGFGDTLKEALEELVEEYSLITLGAGGVSEDLIAEIKKIIQ